jgi:hypothetical protein
MEKPLLRTLLIVAGVATFSLAALSSEPARCWQQQSGDHRSLCLAKAQLNSRYCQQLENPALQSQCLMNADSPF